MIFTSWQDVVVHSVTSDPRMAMETYWREVQSIEEEDEEEEELVVGEEAEEEERKSVDGKSEKKYWHVRLKGILMADLLFPPSKEEEAWLTDAGLSSLVTGSVLLEEDQPPSTEALLSTLTRQQVATVKRRLDRYNQTLRSRNRQPIKDVRDVFTQVGLHE